MGLILYESYKGMRNWRFINIVIDFKIQTEYLSIAEESEENEDFSGYQDWEQDSIMEALMILENWNDYIELPDKYEIYEYDIMESFCYSIHNYKDC